jgi:hypothetical protein
MSYGRAPRTGNLLWNTTIRLQKSRCGTRRDVIGITLPRLTRGFGSSQSKYLGKGAQPVYPGDAWKLIPSSSAQ